MHRHRLAPPAGNCVIVLACLCSACGPDAPRSFPDTTGQTRDSHRTNEGEPTPPSTRISSQPRSPRQDPGGSESEGGPYLFDRVVALCIGIEKYRYVPETPYAVADAQAVGELLRSRYGFTADATLLGEKATKAAILGKLDEYAELLGERDCFILYFAGHGAVINLDSEPDRAPTREGFLIPHEAQLDLDNHRGITNWRREAIDMHDIVHRLETMKTRHALAIVDACSSGFMAMRGSFKARHDLHYYLVNPSRAVIAATTDNQIATPDERRGHGRFTAALLDELTHWADEKKEAADLTDVFDGIRSRMRDAERDQEDQASARPVMTPMMNARLGSGSGEFVFLPKSIRKSDIDYVARLVPGTPTVDGRRHALSGVLGRAQDRENLKATEKDVIEASDAQDYRFSSDPATGDRIWKAKFARFLAQEPSGDPLATAGLHFCAARGLGMEAAPDEAYRWADAAFQRDPDSGLGQFLLGRCYEDGLGVARNDAAALELYKRSEDQGSPFGKLAMGRIAIRSPDADAAKIDEARRLLESAGNSGLADAWLLLADAYQYGDKPGISQDGDKAVEYAARAAGLGSEAASLELYMLSAGPPSKDPGRAATHLQRAAEAGIAEAQYHLAWATCLLDELPFGRPWIDLEKDAFRARAFLEASARQKYPPALCLMAQFHAMRDLVAIPPDPLRAKAYLEEAVALKIPAAHRIKGVWHLPSGPDAIRVYPEDPRAAFAALLQAADLGDGEACARLGDLYECGYGVDRPVADPRPAPPHYGSGRGPILSYDEMSHTALHWYVRSTLCQDTGNHAASRLTEFAGKLALQGVGFRHLDAPGELTPLDVLKKWDREHPVSLLAFYRLGYGLEPLAMTLESLRRKGGEVRRFDEGLQLIRSARASLMEGWRNSRDLRQRTTAMRAGMPPHEIDPRRVDSSRAVDILGKLEAHVGAMIEDGLIREVDGKSLRSGIVRASRELVHGYDDLGELFRDDAPR